MTTLRKLFLVNCLLILLSCVTSCSSPNHEFNQINEINLIDQNVLPDWVVIPLPEIIYDVATQNGERMWLATNAGLLQWNLAEDEIVHISNQNCFGTVEPVYSLLVTDNINLVGSTDLGVFQLGLATGDCKYISLEPYGYGKANNGGLIKYFDDLWLGASGGVIQIKPDSSTTLLEPDTSLVDFSVIDINLVDDVVHLEIEGRKPKDGILTAKVKQHLVYHSNGKWELLDEPFEKILFWRDNRYKLADYLSDILISNDDGLSWKTYLQTNMVHDYLIINNSIIVVELAKVSIINMETGKIENGLNFYDHFPKVGWVNSMLVDNQERIWLGTKENGITMISQNKLISWDQTTPQVIEVLDIAEASDAIYMITSNQSDLYYLSEEELIWTPVIKNKNISPLLSVDSQGNLVVTTGSQLINISNGKAKNVVDISPRISMTEIKRFKKAIINNGNYWLCNNEKLIRIDMQTGKWDEYPLEFEEITAPSNFTKILINSTGEVIVANETVVSRIEGLGDNQKITPLYESHQNIVNIMIDDYDNLWVLEKDSITLIVDGQEYSVQLESLTQGRFIISSYMAHDHVCLLTKSGLFVYSGKSFLDAITSK